MGTSRDNEEKKQQWQAGTCRSHTGLAPSRYQPYRLAGDKPVGGLAPLQSMMAEQSNTGPACPCLPLLVPSIIPAHPNRVPACPHLVPGFPCLSLFVPGCLCLLNLYFLVKASSICAHYLPRKIGKKPVLVSLIDNDYPFKSNLALKQALTKYINFQDNFGYFLLYATFVRCIAIKNSLFDTFQF